MKNALVGLSGGPSVAINSSLAGVISQASKSEQIDKIYGAINGIEGVLGEHLVELDRYSDEHSIELLKQTPAMAIGSCRHRLKSESYSKIAEVFERYNIGYFFYIGGNDSMDTVLKLSKYCQQKSIDVKIIGVPKTIDNDLCLTDHTPGFGSSAKYIYNTVSEIIRDSEIYPVKNVVIVEIMGRDSGYLTLAGGLPYFTGGQLPQIVAIPEKSFDPDEFIEQIKTLHQTTDTVVAVVSEGITTADGEYVGMNSKSGAVDSFGHSYLSGVGKYLEGYVASKIGCKVRSIELNVLQRCATHLASKTDIDEAFLIGQQGVKSALQGETGMMMVYERVGSGAEYKVEIKSADVGLIANQVKKIGEEWFDFSNEQTKQSIVDYLMPLMKGDIEFIKDDNGLIKHLNIDTTKTTK